MPNKLLGMAALIAAVAFLLMALVSVAEFATRSQHHRFFLDEGGLFDRSTGDLYYASDGKWVLLVSSPKSLGD